MEKKIINLHTRWILEEVFHALISGFVPGEDVPKDEYGLWFVKPVSERLVSHFIDDPNMTIEDAMEISHKLMLLIGYTPEDKKIKDEFKTEQ